MNSRAKQRAYKKIINCAKELSENFDTVQIFLTKHSNVSAEIEDTEALYYGLGNKFAIYGQIKNWVLTEERKMTNLADDDFLDENLGENQEGEE
jgi:hypothetical protein